MAPSKCSLTARLYPARQSPAWKKFSHLLSCAAASRAAPWVVLRHTSQIRGSLLCSRSSAAFPPQRFRQSLELPPISAHPRAAPPCMKLFTVLRSNRASIAGQFLFLRSALACSSAVAGSLSNVFVVPFPVFSGHLLPIRSWFYSWFLPYD